jgi:CRP/FNR family transcriptional regulator, cyclic AMP receptor protein
MKHSAATRKGHRPRGAVLLPKGKTLFHSQHAPRRVYLVRRGVVQLAGSDVILDHLGSGEFFGEKLLLSGSRSPQVATTVSPAEVQSFGKRELLNRVQRDRRFAAQLLKGLASRIDRYEESIREFAREPIARRLALVLFRLLPDRPATGWVRLAWNPTNPELAWRVGTTRWRISRLVNRFSRLGWLRREDGLWVDREGLAAYLETA